MGRFLLVCTVVVSSGVASCASCSDNNKVGHLPDAPPPPIDGPVTEDLPPPPVTLTVTRDGQPLAGRQVYFQQADSTLVLAIKTNADGVASAVVQQGGFVTVIKDILATGGGSGSASGSDYQLATFAGVKPGDDLHLDLAVPTPDPPTVTFDLTVPDEQVGNTYTLFSSCGQAGIGAGQSPVRAGRPAPGIGSGGDATLTTSVELSGCGGTADLLVVATNNPGEGLPQVVGWLYKPDVAVADDVPVTLTGGYTEVADVNFSYSGVFTTTDSIDVQRELRSPRGSLYVSAKARAEIDQVDGTMASVSIPMPGPATLQAITTTEDTRFDNKFGRQTYVEWGAAAGYALDLGAAALRVYETEPKVDPATGAIAWTESATGATADFVLGSYAARRSASEKLDTWEWQIAAPYTAGSHRVAYPVLPTTIFDFRPTSDDGPFVVEPLTTVKVPGGYDKVRAHAFNGGASNAIAGATGQIVLEDIFIPTFTERSARAAAAPRSAPRRRFTPATR